MPRKCHLFFLAYRTRAHPHNNLPPSVCLSQDDHKLTLDELNRKYGTDLNNVSVRLAFARVRA